MRIILYTGKGGVGKTSIAAATACKLAQMGKKVLIISTDQAHSLGDSFNQKLSNQPEPIVGFPQLLAMEIDVVTESEAAWGNIKDYFKTLLTAQSGASIEVEELLVFPGFEELFSLLKILGIWQENTIDVLIVDCAPTGETLSLLKFPEMLGGFMTKLLPMERKLLRVAGPAVEKATKIPMPEDQVFDDIEYLYKKIDDLRQLLRRKDTVSIRIVTTPENIVIREAKRNFTFLHLYDYNVDAIIVNKIYPSAALPGYFNKWLDAQEKGLKEIDQSFAGLPIFKMELMKYELRSPERLTLAADQIYHTTDPAAILFNESIFTLTEEHDQAHFDIHLPFIDKKTNY
ncbi:MAG: ArsA family ATPase [Lachnospiraceae bacterium]|jgi:arsenite-transporting ATPase|nr:ArsA family ATPase [Lachnospiraceae bacterium]